LLQGARFCIKPGSWFHHLDAIIDV
jgi:hypothetical protein